MSSWPLPPNTGKLDTSVDTRGSACPRCGQTYRSGELICGYCGLVFSTEGKTQQISAMEIRAELTRKQATGDVYDGSVKTVTCRVGTQTLKLDIGSSLVIGRRTGIEGDPAPDVDLTPFGADEKGVSRRHIRIQNKNQLLYVYDLGSSNGTWLNGRLLVSNSGRPLRDGDEIRLGRMKIQITFG